MTLKAKTYSSVRWTTAGAVVRGLLQVGQVAIVARLLSPEDFGLMAIVGVILGFARLFSDLGVNSAFVQRQTVSSEERSSLFWLNVLVSFGITILVLVMSPIFAGFFGDDRITPLMMLSASTFVIVALGQQLKMMATKMMNFRPLIILETASIFLGFAVAVFGSLNGWGVYALVYSGIVSALAGTVLAWMFLAHGWRPLWRLRVDDVRSFMRFGGALVVDNIVNQLNSTIDIFLGGRLLTATQLGLYSVPRNLVMQVQLMVNPIITRIGFPLISKVQSDIARVKLIYLKTINMTASTNAPIYIAVAFFAPDVVSILIGPNWESSGDLLRIFALWGGMRSLINPVGCLLYGMGRADLSLKWSLGVLLFYPPILWFGSQSGPEGLAWAMFSVIVVLFIPSWFVLVKPLCPIGLAEYSITGLKPFLLATLAFSPAYWLAINIDISALRLAVGMVIGMPLYLLLSYKFNREWADAMLELLVKRSTT